MSSDHSPRFSAEESRLLFGPDSADSGSPRSGRSANPPVAHLNTTVDRPHLLSRFAPVLILLAVMWVVEIVDAILPADLDFFSLQSWNPLSLYGLVTSPLLHSGDLDGVDIDELDDSQDDDSEEDDASEEE